MDITSAQYIVDLDGSTKVSVKATIDGKQIVVPLVTDNRHYAAIFVFKQETAYEIAAAD